MNQNVRFIDTQRRYEAISREIVRALRGRRSQRALSKALGYSTNVIYTWERASASPSASRFFELANRVGVRPAVALQRFFGAGMPRALATGAHTAEGVTALLVELRGKTPIGALASTSGLSRFAISRWLHGKSQPNLPDLLRYIDHASMRLLDFVSVFVDPALLAATRDDWKRIQAARALAYEQPLTHAVLRALELESYRKGGRHRPGRLAAALGVDEVLETECLRRLRESGQIRMRRGVWEPVRIELVDMSREPEAAQRSKAFWAAVAAERTRTRRSGLFAYNLFAVSRRDLVRLQTMQREYLRAMRTVIAASQPSEVVALANFQLFALED